MKIFTTKQAWIWAFTSLLIINIAIIGTLLWQHFKELPPTGQTTRLTESDCDKAPKRGYGKWHEKMGFTSEQSISLKELRDEFRGVTSEIFSNLKENQQAIFDELAKENPDPEILEKLAGETGQWHFALRKATINHMLAIKDVTNPEQYEKMAEMMQQWMFPSRTGHTQPMRHRHRQSNKSDCDD